MWAPSSQWLNHVRAYISRDTRGCRLTAAERLSRFPTSAYCSITWFLEGEVDLLQIGATPRGQRLPRCTVSGCQSHFTVSQNVGDVHGFMVMFFPEVFHALFGVDLKRLHDNFVDAGQVLPAWAHSLTDAVCAAADDAARQAAVEAFLARHAGALQPSAWTRLRRLGENASLRLAASLLKVGPRQIQRLALRDAGLSLRTLSRLWRAERSFLRAQSLLHKDQPLPLAEHALCAGYADQAHFSRECKEMTGRSPTQQVRDACIDEADWIYRLEMPHEPPHTTGSA
jgi:AraC-like DNA-binding protein